MKFDCPKEKEEVSQKASLEELSDYVELEYWQTLEEICAQEEIQLTELPRLVEKHVKNIFDKFDNSESINKEFLFIFKLYHILQEYTGDNSDIKEVKETLSSYQNFVSKFQSYFESTWDENMFHSKFNNCYESMKPRDMLMIQNYHYPNENDIYKMKMIIDKDEEKEQWIKIKEEKDKGSFYISQNVNDELSDIGNTNIVSQNNFHHSTNSAALKGIADQKGLLSRSLLQEKGEDVVSGERSDISSRVYVSESMNYGKQYSFVSWFDEFSVDIEISREEAKEFQEDCAPDHGISLGHKVPIECFSKIFVSSRDIENTKKWSEANCPWVKVYSREAFKCKHGI